MANYKLIDYPQRVEKSILIQAPTPKVWKHLTNPALMRERMGDPEMKIEIPIEWKGGN